MSRPSFTLRLPPLTTKKVWVGFYTDMTGTVAMLFDGHPVKDRALGGYYSVCDERYIASIWADDFAFWFGDLQPFIDAGLIERRDDLSCSAYCAVELDCSEVVEIDMTAVWNEDGTLVGLNTHADN